MEKMIDTKEWKQIPNIVNAFNFLAKATKKDGAFGYVRHFNGFWESTNGHRLHMVLDDELPELEEGFYKVAKNTQTQTIFVKQRELADIRWPNTKKVFPAHKDYKELTISPDISSAYTRVVRALDDKSTIDLNYFKDAVCCDGFYECFIYDNESPIIFLNGDKIAAVMTKRIT